MKSYTVTFFKGKGEESKKVGSCVLLDSNCEKISFVAKAFRCAPNDQCKSADRVTIEEVKR